jgi:hypothetical protein
MTPQKRQKSSSKAPRKTRPLHGLNTPCPASGWAISDEKDAASRWEGSGWPRIAGKFRLARADKPVQVDIASNASTGSKVESFSVRISSVADSLPAAETSVSSVDSVGR